MTTKHTLPTLFAACMALCLAILPLSAATFGNFTYTDNGTSITITYYPRSATGAVEIPAAIGGKPVTSIGAYAFDYCDLTSVTIPSSVTSIGEGAFLGCDRLTSVTIPSSVTSIGRIAFASCGLTSVTIPSSVTSIGDAAFNECISLTSVTIPSSVTSIGAYAFNSCISLTSVTIPSSVTSIGIEAFAHCSSLTSVTIPSSVTIIEFSAFAYCSGLTSVTIPTSITSIGERAFAGCFDLTSVTIPTSVTSIGKFAFAGCGLTSVTIPSSVTSIGAYAFSECDFLTSVTISSGVTSIGAAAFMNCSSLTSFTVDSANSRYSSLSGILFNKTQSWLIQYPTGKVGNSYSIPSSVTNIGNRSFENCTSLKTVTIPSSVTSIRTRAFYGCSGLTTARFLGNAPNMGSFVFDLNAPGFTINYITGKTGFTSPTWLGYPCIGVAATPEIDVQQPVGTSLVDGTSKRSFGTAVVGQIGKARPFTIKNTGTSDLINLVVTKDGTNAGDFQITPPTETTLAPGASTTFKVTFKPTASGTRSAAIHIQSNDSDENPFDIKLAGTGGL